jgi:2-polyprenyl-6-methoxyphenol hydroxylase-like FAD-dependent oxidoreductase
MTQKRVLISGAGIAGSTAAYWLARSGWQVTVVEKAVETRSSGNPIDVRGDAAAVVQRMGLWPMLQQATTQVRRLVVVDAAGRRKATMSTNLSGDPAQEVEVARADLAAALLGAARGEAEVIVGDSISELVQDADGVDVGFVSGDARRFDLVLGADGLHSGVRRIAFGPESLFAEPFGMFVGTMHTSIGGGDPHELRLYNQPGISLSIHPATGNPLAAFIFRSKEPYDHRDPDARKRLVKAAYSGRGWVTDQAVTEWLAAEDVYFDAVTRVTMPTWTKGRISLLGDAADCISLLGEGSSNAIVAAKTLADALAAGPDEQVALAAYETAHRRWLRTFQRRASLNSHILVPETRIGLGVRNTGMRITAKLNGSQR